MGQYIVSNRGSDPTAVILGWICFIAAFVLIYQSSLFIPVSTTLYLAAIYLSIVAIRHQQYIGGLALLLFCLAIPASMVTSKYGSELEFAHQAFFNSRVPVEQLTVNDAVVDQKNIVQVDSSAKEPPDPDAIQTAITNGIENVGADRIETKYVYHLDSGVSSATPIQFTSDEKIIYLKGNTITSVT